MRKKMKGILRAAFIIFFGTVFYCTTANMAIVTNVYAADLRTCVIDAYHRKTDPTWISSINSACDKCFRNLDGREGTIWFNSNSDVNNSNTYVNGATYNISDLEKDNISIYLHGQTYSCNSSSYGPCMDAWYIKFYSDSSLSSGVSYLTNPSENTILWRDGGDCSVRQYAWSQPATSIAVNLDLNKLKREVTPTTSSDGTITYKDEIYIYRCPYYNYRYGISWAGDTPNSGHCYPDTPTELTVIFKPEKRTLTAYAVDVNRNALNNSKSIDSETVNYGDKATVNNSTFNGYTFLGWKAATANSISGCTGAGALTGKYLGTESSYTRKNLTASGAVCAVYGADKKFTVKSVNVGGTSLSGVSGLEDKAKTVAYNGSASITRGTATGYTFMGWRVASTGNYEKDSSVTKYEVSNVTNDITRYAVYTKNTFLGRARVKNGETVDDTNSTGWVKKDATKSIELDCLNSGCKVAFDLSLKTEAGSGKVYYVAKRQGVDSVASPASPRAPGTNGMILKINNKNPYVETLRPGQKMCYSVVFNPDGTSISVTKEVKACATAKVSTFQGKSDVSGSASDTTGWKDSTTKKVAHIADCSPTTGCNVSFTHSLKRTAGIGSTNYVVSRSVNYTSSLRTIKAGTADSNNSVASGTFNSSQADVSKSGAWTLYPGMVVCETLTFKPNNNVVTIAGDVSTTICASAEGDAQPPDPGDPDDPNDPPDDPNGDSESNALIDIQVKNNSVKRYGTYRHIIYAKPGDSLTYRGTYNPNLQYTYYIIPQKMQINGGTVYSNTSSYLFQVFNAKKSSSLGNWNNDTTIFSSNFASAAFSRNYDYTNGSTVKQSETNNHTVLASEVGRSLNEINQTNRNSTTKTTPSQVTFYASGDNNVGNVITTQVLATAYARVPYNFTNTTKITTPATEPLYAGESKDIYFDISVNPKQNNETDGKYATIVKGSQRKLEVCFDGSCYETSPVNGDLNTNGQRDGETENKYQTIVVPDLVAGSQVCIRSAIYPANSGADTNWEDPEGSHTWAYSPQVCFTVAKKPSLQAWGGNVYSVGGISAPLSVKKHLAGYNSYSVNVSGLFTFGSWGELGVISGGTIGKFGSGAELGYSGFNPLTPNLHPSDGAGNNASAPENPGGGRKKDLAEPLGIRVLSGTNSTNIETDIDAINTYLINGQEQNASGDISLADDDEKKMSNGAYYYGGKNLNLVGATVNKGQIYVVYDTGDITISSNITYPADNVYEKLEDVPKVVVYANNILIGCGVERIDAILVAKEKVVTCGKDGVDETAISNSINSSENSVQLKINGAIVARKLIANRTYGAATGANSIIPAEIINFDPTLYLWGGKEVEGQDSGRLTTTYQSELSPRY